MRKYKILAADDSESIINMISHTISKMDEFELFLASNGQQAYDIAIREEPDIMLIDVIMPVMDGIECIKALRKLKVFKHTPIIVLTIVKELQQSFDAGANDFVAKPFEMYELLIRIKRALDLVKSYHQIKSQNEKLKESAEYLHQQRETIAYQLEEKMDILRYANHIQSVILLSHDQINSVFPHHFILNLPKNIVGGDFYWVAQIEHKKIIVLADCTGHGISGALLSLATVSFLNDILYKTSIPDAASLLENLREKIMMLLHQSSNNGEPNDGLDVSVCIFDSISGNLNYAGANNPIYIIDRSGKLEITKPDRLPVGIHPDFNQPFTNYYFPIGSGDFVYLFSDGFADQFGGPNEQKYRYKRLQELLIQIHKKPMKEQKHILEQSISNWKGLLNQVDDILIFGIRL